jgi:hypothetical protein
LEQLAVLRKLTVTELVPFETQALDRLEGGAKRRAQGRVP